MQQTEDNASDNAKLTVFLGSGALLRLLTGVGRIVVRITGHQGSAMQAAT